MLKIPDKYQMGFLCAVLIISVLVVFFQVRSFDFLIYDDNVYVTKNPHVFTGLTLDNIIWAFRSSHYFMWHPATSLSHMLDCELFGLNPSWHHLINLLLHIANILLLFAVLKAMTGRLWPSAFVAALFALHPLNVESVAWIAERKNVLSGFFWLLTIAAYIRYVKLPKTSNYLLLIGVFSLALMSKPTTVTLPFVLLLLDYWPLGRFEKLSLRQLVKEKMLFFTLSAILCIITVATQHGGNVLNLNRLLPFSIRLSNALVSCVTYIGKMFYPVRLAAFYPHPAFNLPEWKAIVSFILLLVISASVFYLRRRKPYLVTGWLWFLGTLIPVIGLVQAGEQAMADRYAYIPLVGLFVIVAWGAADLLENWKYHKIILAVSSIAVVLALTAVSRIQTSYWQNSLTLFEHALEVTNGNYLAYNNVGASLLMQNKFEEAIDPLANAIKINPNYPDALKNFGIACGKVGRLQEEFESYSRAIELYEIANEPNPDLPELHKIVGTILNERNKPEEAAVHFRKALTLKPSDAQLHYELGVTLGRQGKFDEAVEQFNEALRIKPDSAQTHSNLGYALLNQDKLDQALVHLTHAVELDPNSEKSQYYLAVALSEKGELTEAVVHYGEAMRISPNWVEPINTLAWLLATHKDTVVYNPQRAVKLARHACELTNNSNAETLDTLAVAYAAADNFTEAVTTAEKALSIAKASDRSQLADEIQKRL
jgi:tetratricopeptide (TPR) repeat protein